ncbi:MAG: glutamate ligase domain-containing protein, partial [Candidatus Aenigmatarchaeota archaeon]
PIVKRRLWKYYKRDSEILVPLEVTKSNGDYIFRGKKFQLPLRGGYQAENLATSLAVLEKFDEVPGDLESALENVSCPGRMEIVSENPLYIRDGAHNPEAVKRILPEIPEGAICVFSAVKEKDIEKMVSLLEEKVSKFYFTASNVPWCESPEAIARHTSKEFEVVQDPVEAVDMALKEADDRGSVIVTGSLYLIGDIMKNSG